MNLYLLRHGYTDENNKKTYYGVLNPSLNEVGRAQCERIKEHIEKIEFNAVYCSPMARTIETACLVVDREKVKNNKCIAERNFGIFEGKTYEELQQDRDLNVTYENWCNDWINYKIPQGESHVEFCHRIYEFMDCILKSHEHHDNVLIVTHAGVIRAIYTYVMNRKPDLFWKFGCENGDLSMLKYEYGNLFIDNIRHFTEDIYE